MIKMQYIASIDTFGFSIVETMSFGLPSVVVDGMARSEIVKNNKSGFILENQGNTLKYTTNTELEIYLRYANVVDFSHFEFENISERYSSNNFNYVVGKIKLCNLINLRSLLPKIDVFIAVI